jgi:DNA polymerase-3 subunit gamma/tau
MNSQDNESNSDKRNYQVVARKYRPQSFGALIGQDAIAKALGNAIDSNRVGHAYLFTGARGVGKTTSARIFAKCLNCRQGPTPKPCNECEICKGITAGEDIDVLEIDGASNRGIDEIRTLRSNVAICPSRARFKIYIIDEVHMLTREAFNALLKTLEEPPRHVKFIFCTTDPHKVPITVLSRCQRFDFSPVPTSQIAQSLANIVQDENLEAEPEALLLLARRANGSMRDSQSLLEQLLSFCKGKITAADVHRLLGSADMGSVAELATAMLNKDSNLTLNLIHQALQQGVDPGQLAAQLLRYLRDAMMVKANCSPDILLTSSESDLPRLVSIGEGYSLESFLAILQIIDAAVVKMQSSLHARIILEMAAVRVCQLENLDTISELLKQVSQSPSVTINMAQPSTGPIPGPNTGPNTGKPGPQKKKLLSNSQPTMLPSHHMGQSSGRDPVAEPTIPALTAAVQRDHTASSPVSSITNPTGKSGGESGGIPTTRVSRDLSDDESPEAHRGNETSGKHSPARSVETETGAESHQVRVVLPKNDSGVEKLRETSPPEVFSAAGSAPPLGNAELRRIWQKLAETIGGVTADLLSQPESIVCSEGKITVALDDDYKVRECLKPDRKQKIEQIFRELAGREARLEFRVSSQSRKPAAQEPPQLPRAQQMRMLQDHPLVKQAIAIFDAELTNFISPPKRP